MKKKYRFDGTTWERLGRDEELVESIQDERVRRVRSGACKREKAQRYVVRAPDVMNDIMTDENMPARQRIESAKTLRAEILVEYGWLTPIKMRRYDAHKWQIIRKAELFSKVSHFSRDSGLPYAQ